MVEEQKQNPPPQKMKSNSPPPTNPNSPFLLVCVFISQSLSWLTSDICSFAVRVLIYQKTQSITLFSLLTVIGNIPGLTLWPISGYLADRFNRKTLVQVSDVVASVTSLTFAYFVNIDNNNNMEEKRGILDNINSINEEEKDISNFNVMPFYISCFLLSVVSEIQAPAFQAGVGLIVPPEQLDRVYGMIEFSRGISSLVCPVLSGFLLERMGFNFILGMDILFCFLATLSLFPISFKKYEQSEEGKEASEGGNLSNLVFGVHYIFSKPELLSLCVLTAISNFFTAYIFELLPPLVLQTGSVEILGWVSSFAGTGVLCGSLLIAWKGAPSNRTKTITLLTAIQGFTMTFAFNEPNPFIIAAMGFLYCICDSVMGTCYSTLWTEAVPEDIQGRVFSFRNFLEDFIRFFSVLSAGPLSDYIEEKMKREPEDSSFLYSLGVSLTFPGEGRGLRFVFVFCGLLLFSVSTYFHFTAPFHRKMKAS